MLHPRCSHKVFYIHTLRLVGYGCGVAVKPYRNSMVYQQNILKVLPFVSLNLYHRCIMYKKLIDQFNIKLVLKEALNFSIIEVLIENYYENIKARIECQELNPVRSFITFAYYIAKNYGTVTLPKIGDSFEIFFIDQQTYYTGSWGWLSL